MRGNGKQDDERPSMQNVASYAGVSVATVSKVMQGVTSVKKENVIAVQNAIEALGYRINPLAAELRRGRRQVIACIVPTFVDPFVGSYLAALEIAAGERGYTLSIVSSGNVQERECELALRMEDFRVAGAILVGSSNQSDEAARLMADAGIAVISVGLGWRSQIVDSIEIIVQAVLDNRIEDRVFIVSSSLDCFPLSNSIVRNACGAGHYVSVAEYLTGPGSMGDKAVLVDAMMNDRGDFEVRCLGTPVQQGAPAASLFGHDSLSQLGSAVLSNAGLAAMTVAALVDRVSDPSGGRRALTARASVTVGSS